MLFAQISISCYDTELFIDDIIRIAYRTVVTVLKIMMLGIFL